jgi:hypothetical protein
MAPEERERASREPAQGRERWVINKVRALMSWYSKGLDGGSHLRIAVNGATSVAELRDLLYGFFFEQRDPRNRGVAVLHADPPIAVG